MGEVCRRPRRASPASGRADRLQGVVSRRPSLLTDTLTRASLAQPMGYMSGEPWPMMYLSAGSLVCGPQIFAHGSSCC